MRMYDVIKKKRDGGELSEQALRFFIESYTAGEIPDYQVSALLMAIYFQGMTTEESAHLTLAMVDSGDTVDLSMIDGINVDKHSTGGVGDTVTLILAPLVASCGVNVPKMSGRGLGHTGGTIDKLESFQGFHSELTNEALIERVQQHHLAVAGQSKNLVPADKLLYSLRDVTATVDAMPLIASSIMSKKIASGADAIVLDVKTGAGAFMTKEADAVRLAETMVAIGREVGRDTSAIISSMDEPLGHAIGNALEMKEAIKTLNGDGPQDLTELVLTLGSRMLVLAGRVCSLEKARGLLEGQLHNGAAIRTFKAFMSHQGGDPLDVDDPDRLPAAPYTYDIFAETHGVITQINAENIGHATMLLGAGRVVKGDTIDLGAGIVLAKKTGDSVRVGDLLCTIHTNHENPEDVIHMVKQSIMTGASAAPPPLIRTTIASY